MSNFYSNEHIKLYELVEKAWGRHDGASVIIPELQRSFIWEPDRVILLMDSIIKGWPFGTLLLWKLVGTTDLERFPNRGFYRIIDRLHKYPEKNYDKANQITPKSPSAEYLMVLDGQQRLQSLILTVGGQDKWGFKLKNSDWQKHLGKKESKKSSNSSLGVLCINLQELINEYTITNQQLRCVDFTKVFCWGILDSIQDVSMRDFSPLPFVQSTENNGKFIKFSRIWNAIDPNSPDKPRDIGKKISDSLFDEWGVLECLRDNLIEPITDLLDTIRNIKNQEVYYLQISPYSTSWNQQEYNEAIVNVFTRLNTAGRALKQEEITMAWLKVGWEPTQTNNKTAVECLEELRSAISPIWQAESEEEVRLISYIWALFHHEGKLIDAKELLNGEIMQPMAGQISLDWMPFLESIKEGASLIEDRNLKKEVFSSFNAIIVALSVFYLTHRWKHVNSSVWSRLNDRDKENFDKQIEGAFNPFVDRWILCSQWAGIWASSSGQDFQNFANDIATSWKNDMCAKSALNDFIDSFSGLCNKLLKRVSDAAETHVRTIEAERSTVSQYYTILWLWHRLEQARFENSRIQMRIKQSGKGRTPAMKMEVDHAISYSSWCDLVEKESTELKNAGISVPAGELGPPPKDFSTKTEAFDHINQLGNCSLLHTNFNRSKNKGTLWSFMQYVDEFKNNNNKREKWEEALCLSTVLTDMCNSDSKPATCLDIKTDIDTRTKQIREEVISYIKDITKKRFGIADHVCG